MTDNERNLWEATKGERYNTRKTPSSGRFDLIVIGGGFTGLSAALHSAQAGMSVCVVEAKSVGHGGSGRNVGLVNAGLWTPPDEVETILGKEAGEKLNVLLANGPQTVFDLIEKHQIQCDAVRHATMHCAETQAGLRDLEKRYAQQVARGAPVQLLGPEEAKKRTGSDRFLGALLDARAGTIQPLSYAQGLARAAIQAGATILENMPVQAVARTDGSWAVSVPSSTITAQKLIQATNAYGVGGVSGTSFIPIHYFQFATEPLSIEQREVVLPDGEGCWDCASVMSSFRMDADGRLLIGAVGNLEGVGAFVHRAWARRKLASLFPKLRDVPFTHSWCGRIAFTSDHLPKVVSLGQNAISIFGYSGRGISPGTVFGKCAADWAVNDNPDAFPIPIIEEHKEPLSELKAAYYEAGAVLTHFFANRT